MSQFEIIIKIVSRQKTGQKMRLTSICFKEEKVMKKKLAMVLTGVAVCGLLMVACQGKDKGAVTDDVQTEGVEPVEQATPEATEPEAAPEAAEPEATPEAEETGNETAPEAGEAEGAGESEGEDAEDSADAKPEAGAEGEDGSADVNAAENEEPQEEADTETKAN